MQAVKDLEPIAVTSRDLLKQIDQLHKFVENHVKDSNERGLNRLLNALDDLRKQAIEQLKQVHYIFKQAHWLQERFPEARLRDVEGLVKLVDIEEIKANDWSLTPGRKEVDEKKLIRYGDVLINSTGTGTLGRVAQCWNNPDKCTVSIAVHSCQKSFNFLEL